MRQIKNEKKMSDSEYRAIHMWVASRKGTPKTCEHCRGVFTQLRSIHWANISGEYKRDLNDWIRLCVVCHKSFDTGRTDRHGNPTGKIIRPRTSKTYGFLRCHENDVPKLKVLSAQLGYPSMVAFLEAVSKLSVKDFNRLKLDK